MALLILDARISPLGSLVFGDPSANSLAYQGLRALETSGLGARPAVSIRDRGATGHCFAGVYGISNVFGPTASG